MPTRPLTSWKVAALLAFVGACSGQGTVEVLSDDADAAPYASEREPITGTVVVGAPLEVMFPVALRAQPLKSSTILATLPAETIVTAVASSPQGSYYNVRFGTQVGWVKGYALTLAIADVEPAAPAPNCTLVSLSAASAVSDGTYAWFLGGTYGTPADSSSAPTQSTLRLFENGLELGPAHSLHADIRNLGMGRFSHYSNVDGTGESIRFSSSNNSDPRSNGLKYAYCVSAAAPAPTPTPIPSAIKIGPQPVAATALSAGTLFASPGGSGTNCSSASPCSVVTVLSRAGAGAVVFLRGGTYPVTGNIYFGSSGSAASPITVESYPGETAVFDGAGLAAFSGIYIRITGKYYRLRRFEIKNMPHVGLWIGGTNNLVEGMFSHHNKNGGIQIFSPYESFPYGAYGSYNTLKDCTVSDNSGAGLGGEYAYGGNSDGISISSGEGNKVLNCAAYRNSDDGIDSWRSTNTYIYGSIAAQSGIDQGNGNGFKAGGLSPSRGTIIEHSIAYRNKSTGFDFNSGVAVRFSYATSWSNARGYTLGTDTIVEKSIASGNGAIGNSGGVQSNNSWQRSGTVSFISIDPLSLNFLKPTAGAGFDDIGAYAP